MKSIIAALALLSLTVPAHAADKGTAEAAYAEAVQAEHQAGDLGNRWLPAETALKAAKAALAAQAWDDALSQSNTARALALRAVEQSREQETLWRDVVIR